MQEAQVSVDGVSHPLPQPFLVVATQNPIEYEGTYPLPEAQLDRFLLKVDVGYPTVADEEAILRLAHRGVAPATLEQVQAAAGPADIAAAQAEVDATTVADEVGAYVVAVVRRTSTALWDIGSDRNRSMTPFCRSSARLEPVMVDPKTTVWAKIPAIRNSR